MPQPYDIADLALPEDSEMLAVLRDFPHAETLRFGDDEFLVRAGDKGAEFYLLIRGTCLVELPPPSGEDDSERRPGNELTVLTATPDAPVFVGEMACFGDGLRSASVRSSMNSVAVKLLPPDLHDLLMKFPNLTRTLCEQFSRRLEDLNERLREHRQHLNMKADQRFVEPGAVLFERGQPARKLYQLVDGVVEIEDAEGRTEQLRPGRGEMTFVDAHAFFSQGDYTVTAKAVSMVIAIGIDASSREAVVRNFPHVVLRLLES